MDTQMNADAHGPRARGYMYALAGTVLTALASAQTTTPPALGQPPAAQPEATPSRQPPPQPPMMPVPDAGRTREAVVTLKDGQKYTGELIERTTERVVLRISNIDTPIPIGMVDRVDILPPLLERYRAMR